MQNGRFQSFLFLAAFLGALFFSPTKTFGKNESQEPLRLSLNWKPEPQFGGFYEALGRDYFKKEGLNIELLPGGSGTPTLQMLNAGKSEYAIVSADELLIAMERGAEDLVALFAVFQNNPQGILVHGPKTFSLSQILSRPDHRLLWQAGLPYALALKKKFPEMKIQTAPYPGGIGAFLADQKILQQCFVTSEPLAVRKATAAPFHVFLISDVTDFNPYTTVLITKRSRLKDSPNQVQAILRAVRKGWISYLTSSEDTNKKMQALNPAMDLETFNQSAQTQAPLILPKGMPLEKVGEMSLERWQHLQTQLYDLGLLKTKKDLKGLLPH